MNTDNCKHNLDDIEYDGSITDSSAQVDTLKSLKFESEIMKKILKLREPDPKISNIEDLQYKSCSVMPNFVTTRVEWSDVQKSGPKNVISDILSITPSHRNHSQNMTLSHWIMDCWNIAATLGPKKVVSLLYAMKLRTYEPGDYVMREGDRGRSFFIIVTGEVNVTKEGVGIVARFGKSGTFGEIALTSLNNDLRTASVVAVTRVEALAIHKTDFDHFLADSLICEQRENFKILRDSPLFKKWTRQKVEKLAGIFKRKSIPADTFVFKQGEEPDNVYFILEGEVNIQKDVIVLHRNRWPSSLKTWDEYAIKINQPVLLSTLKRAAYFGEDALLPKSLRQASAITLRGRCLLLYCQAKDFLHELDDSEISMLSPGSLHAEKKLPFSPAFAPASARRKSLTGSSDSLASSRHQHGHVHEHEHGHMPPITSLHTHRDAHHQHDSSSSSSTVAVGGEHLGDFDNMHRNKHLPPLSPISSRASNVHTNHVNPNATSNLDNHASVGMTSPINIKALGLLPAGFVPAPLGQLSLHQKNKIIHERLNSELLSSFSLAYIASKRQSLILYSKQQHEQEQQLSSDNASNNYSNSNGRSDHSVAAESEDSTDEQHQNLIFDGAEGQHIDVITREEGGRCSSSSIPIQTNCSDNNSNDEDSVDDSSSASASASRTAGLYASSPSNTAKRSMRHKSMRFQDDKEGGVEEKDSSGIGARGSNDRNSQMQRLYSVLAKQQQRRFRLPAAGEATRTGIGSKTNSSLSISTEYRFEYPKKLPEIISPIKYKSC